MFGYILTAAISATITMVVMACFQVGKDPREDIQQIQPPRHEPIIVSSETGTVRNVIADCFVNYEEMNNPEPYVRKLIKYRLMEKLSEQLWQFLSVSKLDDKQNCRVNYMARIKIIDMGHRHHISTEDVLWKS